MGLRRGLALAVLAGLTYGSVAISGGYAWYYRSAAYRERCARVLSETLGLPAEIGQVVPRGRNRQEYRKIQVWLPERRGLAARCDRAVLTGMPSPTDERAYELALLDGRCEISSRTWLRGDYRTVLESGLRPMFDPRGPRRVIFTGMDLHFDRDRFRAELDDAHGLVWFEQPDHGQAHISCREFNGYNAPRPVSLRAAFSPQVSGIRLDRVEVEISTMPLQVLGLQDLAGIELQSGTFNGRLTYLERDGDREMLISGQTRDVRLSECSGPYFDPPWRGSVPFVQLEELRVVNGWPVRAWFKAVVADAILSDLLAPWGLPEFGGKLFLRVEDATLSQAGVDRFVAAGRCEEVVLDRAARASGWGEMTGTATVVIEDLTIKDNQLAAFDAVVTVAPAAAGQCNWMDRKLLLEVARRALGIELPDWLVRWLPQRLEYAQLGVRLEVRDEILQVFGTHGPREKTILSVRVGGQELAAVVEPESEIDLRPWLDGMRAEARQRIAARLAELERKRPPE